MPACGCLTPPRPDGTRNRRSSSVAAFTSASSLPSMVCVRHKAPPALFASLRHPPRCHFHRALSSSWHASSQRSGLKGFKLESWARDDMSLKATDSCCLMPGLPREIFKTAPLNIRKTAPRRTEPCPWSPCRPGGAARGHAVGRSPRRARAHVGAQRLSGTGGPGRASVQLL